MNNSYVNYFKSRMPMKILSSIFRYYKRSYEAAYKNPSLKRNCSEPPMAYKRDNGDSVQFEVRSEAVLKYQKQEGKQKSKSTSNVELSPKCCSRGNGVKGKLESSVGMKNNSVSEIFRNRNIKSSTSSVVKKESYPWQNYNMKKSHHQNIRRISSVTSEIVNKRKSILKKNSSSKTKFRQKEVRFDKNASNSNSAVKRTYPWQNFNLDNIPEPGGKTTKCTSGACKEDSEEKPNPPEDELAYSQLDLSIREKIEKLLDNTTEICRIRNLKAYNSKPSVNRAYPWQNFNLENIREPEYKTIRQINSVTSEIIRKKYTSTQCSVVNSVSKAKDRKFCKNALTLSATKSKINLPTKKISQRNIHLFGDKKRQEVGQFAISRQRSVRNKKQKKSKMT